MEGATQAPAITQGRSTRRLALTHFGRPAARVVHDIWPAYVLASLLILVGFKWGLPAGKLVPLSWQDDENGAVVATGHISFPAFHPNWLPWGTALFYQVYVVKTALSLAGLLAGSHRDLLILGRLVVYASALGAITATYLLGRSLFDAWTGRAAALLLAVSPGFVVTAHYFKVEVPMSFWLLLTLLGVFRMRKTREVRDVMVVGLLAGYTASTQYSGVLVLVAAVTALIQAPPPKLRRCAAVLGASAAGGFLVGTPYALLDPRAFYYGLRLDAQINHAGSAYTPARPPALIDYPLNILPYALTVPLAIVAIIGIVLAVVRERARLLPLWALLGAYVLLLSLDNARIVRAMTPVLPILALFAAYGLGHLRGVRWLRAPVLIALGLLTGYALLFSFAYIKAFARDDPRVQASRWIERNIPHKTRIAISTNYYLDVPQLADFGYRTVEVGTSATRLVSAPSRYLVLSDMSLLPALQALDHHPDTARLLAAIRSDYCELAHFENSQRVLWINAKARGGKLPFDWLYANPRITVLERRSPGTPCHVLEAYRPS